MTEVVGPCGSGDTGVLSYVFLVVNKFRNRLGRKIKDSRFGFIVSGGSLVLVLLLFGQCVCLCMYVSVLVCSREKQLGSLTENYRQVPGEGR